MTGTLASTKPIRIVCTGPVLAQPLISTKPVRTVSTGGMLVRPLMIANFCLVQYWDSTGLNKL